MADELDFFAEAAEPRKEMLADLHICCHREIVIVLFKIECILTLAESLNPVFADVLRLATGCEQVIVAVVKQLHAYVLLGLFFFINARCNKVPCYPRYIKQK